jgi:hypothetical protein
VNTSSPPAQAGSNRLTAAYDAALLLQLRFRVEDLDAALAAWAGRDDGMPDAPARRAANGAMGAIDGMLRELHAMRSRLTGEIRASDDATAARVDALLRAGR